MIYTLISYVIYIGITFLVLLALKLLYELIQKKKQRYLKTIRLLVNYLIILYFSFACFLGLALIVVLPVEIGATKEQTHHHLRLWLINEITAIGTTAVIIILTLALLSYLYQRFIEKHSHYQSTVVMSIVNCIIIGVVMTLIYIYNYIGLGNEIELRF